MNDNMLPTKEESISYIHKRIGKKAAIYNNDLNRLNIGAFPGIVQDVFVTVIACCRSGEEILKDDLCLTHYTEISFDDFRRMIKCTERGDKNLTQIMERFADQLVGLRYKIINPERIIGGSLFPLYEIDLEKRVLKVTVSPSLSYILNNTDSNFTEFMVEDHTRIKGKNAKTLYRILCQWKQQGHTKWYDVNELKNVFGMDNYDTKNFIRELKKAMAELSQRRAFYNLDIDFKHDNHYKGAPIREIKFTFKKTFCALVDKKREKSCSA